MTERPRLRKRPLEADAATTARADEIDIAGCASIAYSSEDPAHPLENLFDGRSGPGATRWMSARPDTIEHIVLEFDQPQTISRLVYEVEEAIRERTQEIRVEVSEDGGRTYRQILVQEYTFSPGGATYQREDQRFNLHGVTHLRLTIVPNKNGPGTARCSNKSSGQCRDRDVGPNQTVESEKNALRVLQLKERGAVRIPHGLDPEDSRRRQDIRVESRGDSSR